MRGGEGGDNQRDREIERDRDREIESDRETEIER